MKKKQETAIRLLDYMQSRIGASFRGCETMEDLYNNNIFYLMEKFSYINGQLVTHFDGSFENFKETLENISNEDINKYGLELTA